MKQHKGRILQGLQHAGTVIAGNALLAFLVAAFVIPHNIIMGGTTGIGIVLGSLFQFDTAVFVLLLNLLFLIWGGIVLGKKFFLSTIASSILYPLLLGIFQRIPQIESLTDNTLLAAVFAGALLGLALGLVLRAGFSTGGIDALNLILYKWFHWPIASSVYITDLVVIGGQALFFKPGNALYALLALVIETVVLDQVMVIGQAQIQILAISNRFAEIRQKLLTDLHVGVTMVQIETGHLGQEQQGVLCVIPTRKLYDITETIQSIDPNVFMTITRIKEVRGRGFTKERQEILLSKISNTSN